VADLGDPLYASNRTRGDDDMASKGSTSQANFYEAVGLYNDCVQFLPELEAVVAKLEAALFELVQVKNPVLPTFLAKV
jgi:hypothetical protein